MLAFALFLVMQGEAMFLWGIVAAWGLTLFFLTFGACQLVARRVQIPGTSSARRGWVCMALAALPFLALVGFAGVGEPLMLTGPLAAAGGLAISFALASVFVARNWRGALGLALTGMLGHVLMGWPAIFLPWKPVGTGVLWAEAHKTYWAGRHATRLLADYGLKIPAGYQVVGVEELKDEALGMQARVYLTEGFGPFGNNANYSLYQTKGQALQQWAVAGGYRATQVVFGHGRLYVDEPRAVVVGTQRKNFFIYGDSSPSQHMGYEIGLYREQDQYHNLKPIYPEWQSSDPQGFSTSTQ